MSTAELGNVTGQVEYRSKPATNNGDGKRATFSGSTPAETLGVWFMNGTTVSSTSIYGNVGTTWGIQVTQR